MIEPLEFEVTRAQASAEGAEIGVVKGKNDVERVVEKVAASFAKSLYQQVDAGQSRDLAANAVVRGSSYLTPQAAYQTTTLLTDSSRVSGYEEEGVVSSKDLNLGFSSRLHNFLQKSQWQPLHDFSNAPPMPSKLSSPYLYPGISTIDWDKTNFNFSV
jgi:predicted rRNA methylase YqxC with S4 and FtsJ domains